MTKSYSINMIKFMQEKSISQQDFDNNDSNMKGKKLKNCEIDLL